VVMIIIIFVSRCWRIVHQYNNCTGDVINTILLVRQQSRRQGCRSDVYPPPNCEILCTPMVVTMASIRNRQKVTGRMTYEFDSKDVMVNKLTKYFVIQSNK